jgi:hypothetical protein
MHSPDVVKMIDAIRNSHPDMENLYRFGQCYNFHLILRSVFPTAEAYYSPIEGHVYTKLFGYYYDIRGVHYKLPIDLEVLDHSRGDPPHRWGERDTRRLIEQAVSLEEVKRAEREAIRKRYTLIRNALRGIAIVGGALVIWWALKNGKDIPLTKRDESKLPWVLTGEKP